MNKRIQELAIEAAGRDFQTFATSDLDSPAKIQRFAELIVQECVLISRTSTDGFTAGRRMEERFGVEE